MIQGNTQSKAAMGNPITPRNPAMPCPTGRVMSKMEAIASPMPAMNKNHKPTLPALVWTWDRMATASAQDPIPQDKNIGDSIQP